MAPITTPLAPLYSPISSKEGLVTNAAWLDWFKRLALTTNALALDNALLSYNNLSDVENVGISRSNLGLGTLDSPLFAGLTLSGLSPSLLVGTDAGKNLVSIPNEAILALIGLGPEDSPTFAGLTIDNLNSILYANFGNVGATILGPSLSLIAPFFNTIQNIRTIDYPTFAGLFLTEYLDFTNLPEPPTTPIEGNLKVYVQETAARGFLETIGNQGITLRLGRDNVLVVKCGEVAGILKGKPVFIDTVNEDLPIVKAAQANTPLTMPCAALALENLDYEGNGLVMLSGRLKGVDTSAFTLGKSLYVAAITPGLTDTLPLYPYRHQRVGSTLKVGVDDGEILVDIGSSLPEYKFLSGILQRTSTLTYASGILSVNHVSDYSVFTNGREWFIQDTRTVALPLDHTLYFVYFDETGTLVASTTPWDILGTQAGVAIVYRVSSSLAAVGDERHPADGNRSFHMWGHETLGCRYDSLHGGLTGSFGATTFSINEGSIWDEDLEHEISTQTTCRIWYRINPTTMTFEDNQVVLYKLNGTNIQYDNAGVLTDATPNWYVNHYVYATNDVQRPIYSQIGQMQHTTIASARDAVPPVFGNLTTVEWKLLYKVIYRNTGSPPTYVEALDYRVASGTPVNFVPTAHASLTGLTADDHLHYWNETRGMERVWFFGA